MSQQNSNEMSGLIDHNVFDAPFDAAVQGITVVGAAARVSTHFSRPLALGSGKFIFAEDNVFNYAYQNDGILEGYGGARFVFRHNAVHGGTQGSHGADSGNYRGTHSYEIYDNTFDLVGCPTCSNQRAITFRSGTGVVYDNTVSTDYGSFHLRNYRSSGTHGIWGECDGTSVHDGNPGWAARVCLSGSDRARVH